MRLEFCPERTSQVSHRCKHTSHHPFIYTLVHRHIYTSCSRATRSWGLVNWRELIDLLVIWDRKCLEIYSLWPKGDGDGVSLCVCVWWVCMCVGGGQVGCVCVCVCIYTDPGQKAARQKRSICVFMCEFCHFHCCFFVSYKNIGASVFVYHSYQPCW